MTLRERLQPVTFPLWVGESIYLLHSFIVFRPVLFLDFLFGDRGLVDEKSLNGTR